MPAGNAHDRARLPLAELPGGAAAWAALAPAECYAHPCGCPGWALLRELRAWAADQLGLRCASSLPQAAARLSPVRAARLHCLPKPALCPPQGALVYAH